MLVYLGTLSLANSLDHAVSEFGRLWYWMVPLIIGFAVQVGLFAYARGTTRGKNPAGRGGMVATGSTSSLSMVVCCAHHLSDVLPLLGLAGAALVLSTYQSVLLLVGVLSNAIGAVYMLGVLSKHRLFPADTSALSVVLRWPVERSLRFVVAGSALVLVVVIAMEVL